MLTALYLIVWAAGVVSLAHGYRQAKKGDRV